MTGAISNIRALFESAGYGPLSIAVAAILGVLSAVACSGCTLPLIGAVMSYSVAQPIKRTIAPLSMLPFVLGICLALVTIGSVFVFAGQAIAQAAGPYWKIAAGVLALLFGIGALELFPFKLPGVKLTVLNKNPGALGFGISGVVFGGAIALSSLCCNPGIFIILGASALQQHIIWAFLNLIAYSVGFSIPLAALVYGISLSKDLLRLQRLEKGVRISAGILLIGIGIYLFYSF